ncbi:membrane protein [Pseudomonas chlororaphis]|uniref:Membrane protein n=1 Tax=Pseudomonas chlororaphis TaxID=587753 RepID=A0A0G3GKS2_9PSED|nr:membrane protein [Pseudomonas chlororaphis]
MLYLGLKYLHVIAAIFLFGFGMGSYLYLIAASRTANPQVIAHVARTVVRYDAWITTPAGFIQIATGYWLVSLAGLSLTTGWVLTSLIIFLCVGMLWLPVLVLQKRLQHMASSAADRGEGLAQAYRRVYRQWFWMGVAGFSGMFVIVSMMVTKMTPGEWVGLFLS